MAVVFATRDYFPYLFTNSDAVAAETTKLAILLGFTVLLNSLQPVLSGEHILNITPLPIEPYFRPICLVILGKIVDELSNCSDIFS